MYFLQVLYTNSFYSNILSEYFTQLIFKHIYVSLDLSMRIIDFNIHQNRPIILVSIKVKNILYFFNI